MMFLLNDVVLRLDGVAMDARLEGQRMQRLSFPAILRMGQELFSREPLLQRTNPERARRLSALITAKAPMINAALFVAPSLDCPPHEVTVRFVACEFEVMAELAILQRDERLDAVSVDRKIWRRLAA
ncbi:hypothetical protein [Phenylobacterium sp.]|uniref:hypothetical protein n=1 Tax=Phenylobacterium sp. TaxID=1871053 RepID=UPI0011F47976|nr:hypothetical protein [Phenylobacterium sp.]THD59098.1 MAG: hypothetical protein E8A49_16985 [Phenylobacterium sp.]